MAIQPKITKVISGKEVMQTEDPTTISFATNLIRLWALERNDLPSDFVDDVALTNLSRQPVALFQVQIEVVRRDLQEVTIPYTGGPVHSDALPTMDLLS